MSTSDVHLLMEDIKSLDLSSLAGCYFWHWIYLVSRRPPGVG